MDQLSLQIEKITGLADEKSACSVFTKRITLADNTVGTFVSCVLISVNDGQDIQTLLKDIFEISSKKIEAIEAGLLEAIKSAGDACYDYVQGKEVEISFVHAFFYKEACYLDRRESKVKIFLYEFPKSEEVTFEYGSGLVKPGQIYLIATDSLLSIFDSSVFAKKESIDLEEIIDGLATEISAQKNQGGFGAAFIFVKNKISQEPEEPRPPSTEAEGSVGQTKEPYSRQGFGGQAEETGGPEELTDSEIYEVQPKRSRLGDFLGVLRAGSNIRAIFRSRRNLVIAALVVLLILFISVAFTLKQKSDREKLAQFNEHLTQASSKYDEAKAILELNNSRARGILVEADKEIKLAQALVPSDVKANKLSDDIAQSLKQTEVQSTINFQVLSESSQPISSLSFRGKKLIGISSDKLYEVDPSTKSVNQIDGPGNATGGFIFDDEGFILANDKVFRVNLANGKSEQIIAKQGARDIAVFLGNVYLLLNRQITKFSPIENGYTDGVDYLTEPVDFSDSSRFTIDGSVWVGSSDKIFKFLRGQRQDFEISGLTSSIGEFGTIYTTTDLSRLYVIDKTNSALLVIDKGGLYKKVYQSPEFARASDMVVGDDGTKLYLSTGSKILEANLE